MPAPGGLALLIGKRLDKKGGGGDKPDAGPPMGGSSYGDEEGGDTDGDAQKDAMEDSAISDFMNAKDPKSAKLALKDFLESCYPQLAGDEEAEAGPESEPMPEA